MTNKKRYSSLSQTIVTRFCLFILFLSLAYSFLQFMFLYTVEDAFIQRGIEAEANYLVAQKQDTGSWVKPRFRHIKLHVGIDEFPEEVKTLLLEEPNRIEFFGNNDNHYHLYKIPNYADHYLLAEVSKELLIRPIRPYLLWFLSIFTLLVSAMAVWLGWKMSRKLIAPLTHLAELVHQTKPDHLPNEFAKDYPNNEIGKLADTLEESMTQIKAFVDREQHFTRDASHELRTPIAIVKSAAELLSRESTLPSASKEQVERILQASNNMQQTIESLLSLARESSDKHKDTLCLLPLVEKCVINHHHLLESKSVEVDIDIESNTQITVNVGAIEILLANLISNAFHHTQQGVIKITGKANQITVSDSGPGIDENISDKVLNAMVKGKNSQGFGIGLSVVKRLCEHHLIAFSIKSDSNGTIVTLTC